MNYTKNSVLLIVVFQLVFSLALQCQTPTPGPIQTESIAYTNATLHLGTGDKILEGAIGFKDGKIDYVGSTLNLNRADYNQVIDGVGNHIYPAFIAPNSTLGLQEIGAVRATRDQYEIGEINPHIRSVIAFQTESEITPTIRTNGVLYGQITPRGSFVGGQSSVVHFDGWNWEDALVKEGDGIHIYWPRMYENDHTGKTKKVKTRESYDRKVSELKAFLKKAQTYSDLDSNLVDLRLEAFSQLLENEKTLYVHTNHAKSITAAVDLKREFGIERMHIVGGRQAHLMANLLKENNVGVMLARVHDLPYYNYSDVDLPYKLPALLSEAGVMWCFENAGDMEQMNSRNLPFYAGTAVAYGLDYEQAVKALTLNTAKMLGVDSEIGSLEIGKLASIVVSKGDALDMMTNDVSAAYIEGRRLELNNRQIQLYQKYKQKYERLNKN